MSFSELYDSLGKYDSLVIEVKDPAENGVADTVFTGKARAEADLENLNAPHYHGAKATILITGFNDGEMALRLEKEFDGATGKTVSTDSLVLSDIALVPDSAALHLKAGDSADLPKVTVTPASLADKTLRWSTSDAAILAVDGARILARSAGHAALIARLKAFPAKETVIFVTVAPVSVIPKDSVPAPLPPVAPVFASLSAGDSEVTLVWGAVPGADSYNLYYGEGGSVDKGSTRIKSATSPYEVKGLKNGVAYGFALTAVNGAGESGLGEAKVATPRPSAPFAPAIDSATPGNGNLTLSWQPVPGALAYAIYYKPGNSVDKSAARIAGITSPYTLSGLANGTPCTFSLAAIMASAESGLGNIVTVTPQAPPIAGLSYPANPAVYWQGIAIPPNPAAVSGDADGFTVTPELPKGLSLDKSSGTIAGTPAAPSATAVYIVKAKGSGGETAVALALTVNGPPAGLAYSMNPASYWQTAAIETNTASVSGIVDSFTVSPALPAGLVLSRTTGAISGTPSTISDPADYAVTAWNKAGSASATLRLGVKGPPSGMSYASNPAVYWRGVAIAPNAAMVSGSLDSFTVSPALPAGLSLDRATGTLSGTPAAASPATAYTITAKNAAGTSNIALTLAVIGPPAGLSYAAPAPVYWQNVAIAPNPATVTGIVDSFTVAPALPAGLSLDKATGEIKGTATAAAASAKYLVTAHNQAGTAAAELTFAVKGPPSGITYAANPVSYLESAAIAANTVSVSGAVDGFTVTPALPAGLSLDKATGAITGTPTTASAAADYVVTARNPAGTATAKVNIAIVSPLADLGYAANPAVYWKGVAIAVNTAALTGKPDSFTISPELPPGLALDKTTGSIYGTPTAAAAAYAYLITAKSPVFGNTTANLTITVNGPPSIPAYAANPATYWKGVAIAPNAASLIGVADSFTVSPALPAGLALDKATGSITGTPSATSAASAYVITAWNPAGSATLSLSLAVNGPPALAYAPAAAALYQTVAMTPITPSLSGVVDSVTVSPALPAGLTVDAVTGRISGTPTALANGSYAFTAWNKAGFARDTLAIAVSSLSAPLPIQQDLSIDSSNWYGYNVGYTPLCFLGKWPRDDYQTLMQFDLSGVPAAGLVSAKLVLKTYAFGPGWTGAPITLKAHIFKIKDPWTEGTGNWYWPHGGWDNNGDLVMANYGLSDAVKAASTDPGIPSGSVYTDHYLVRQDSLIEVGTGQNVTLTYPAASTRQDFYTAAPGPADLVDIELDLSAYVREMAGNPSDHGFIVYLENLPTYDDHVVVLSKEVGDGSYGAKLYLNY